MKGHRRKALKELGIKALCRIYSPRDYNNEVEAIIEFNRQRKKTTMQVFNETEALDGIYRKEAEKRQKELSKTRPNICPDLTANLPEGPVNKSKGVILIRFILN